MGCHFLLQGIFLTQGSNPGLLHCRWILYWLSYEGSPFSIVQFSRSVMSDSLQPHGPQHARPPCPSPTPGVHPNPCPSSRWWCTNSHYHQQDRSVPSSPYLFQRLLFVNFLGMAILTRVRWFLTVVLTCVYLIISNVVYLFMCLLAICMTSLEKCLGLIPFISWVVWFLLLSYMSCLCILEIIPLSVLSFANIFSHSIGCLFIFAYGFLCCAIAYNLD